MLWNLPSDQTFLENEFSTPWKSIIDPFFT